MNNKVYLAISVILGLPKSLFFNLKYFGKDGIKFPCLLSHKVKLRNLKGTVSILAPYEFSMVKLGFSGTPMYDDAHETFLWDNCGDVIIRGSISIRNGCVIVNKGILEFGEGFHVSSPSKFICEKGITFGKDCLIGWGCQFSDTDAHKIYQAETNVRLNEDREINVGSHVWFGAFCKVYKGVTINDGCVVAANTVLTHSFQDENAVIGGLPNRVLRHNIIWEI